MKALVPKTVTHDSFSLNKKSYYDYGNFEVTNFSISENSRFRQLNK